MNHVDHCLIQECLSGSKDAWDRFILRYSDLIYDSILRTFRKYGYSGQGVEADIHNDIFVQILEEDGRVLRIFEGRNGCQLGHYLRTITVRRTVDHLRKLRPSLPYEEESELAGNATASLTDSDGVSALFIQEEIAQARQLISELSGQERELCRLLFLEQLPTAVVAGRLGITQDHLYVRKSRLLERLRSMAAAQGITAFGEEARKYDK
ncbi:MAG: sigma-70 family RNA polymerase sigma factor [Candidatus Omnitrophica bacterium]|nr:sigma-70 family RNA polymerase sigma factor [Candidatus Omnitrophota bacterium]